MLAAKRIKRTLTVRKKSTKSSEIWKWSHLKNRVKTGTGLRISSGQVTIRSIKNLLGWETSACHRTPPVLSLLHSHRGRRKLNAGNLTDSAFPVAGHSKNLWTLKAPGSAASGSVSSDKMTTCTDPCLCFWCLSLFIPPPLYTFPSSCLVHLSLCFTLPHLLILSFLLSLKQGCSNRLQLQ